VRREPINENDKVLAPIGPMGVAIAINFQSTGGGKAAITGRSHRRRSKSRD
jgi:hypothetical protein